MSLTVALVSARNAPRVDWVMDSLALQENCEMVNQFIFVHPRPWQINLAHAQHRPWGVWPVMPMPNIWAGTHRVTKEDWWHTATARNTAACFCKNDWILYLDDRSVLLPGFLDAVAKAMKGNYAVCGAYEKRKNMTVRNGVIHHAGIVTGEDVREKHLKEHKLASPFSAPGEWMFGCAFALPLEWLLEVNGQDTTTDGSGAEDCFLGLMVKNNGHEIKYDTSMKIIEDRTEGLTGPVMRKEDAGTSPNDLSHKILDMLKDRKTALHYWNPSFNLRTLRQEILAGEPFPVPEQREYRHFWNNQLLTEWYAT